MASPRIDVSRWLGRSRTTNPLRPNAAAEQSAAGAAAPEAGAHIPIPLRWHQIDASQAPAYAGEVDRILAQETDGMTITNIFSEDEIRNGLANLECYAEDRIPFVFGYMLGMPLNLIGDESRDLTPFFDDTEKCRAIYAEAFGFDLHERIVERLAPLFPPVPMVAPRQDGRSYNPGNFRWWLSERGGLPAHAGNEFVGQVGNGAMAHLLSVTNVLDHLSYFVVLQRPEKGGALSVYHLLQRDYNTHDTGWADAGRDDRWFDDQPHTVIDPPPGSMVLFGGGWRWHRVDPIHGPVDRITYGGFAGPSHDRSEFHFWC